MALKALVPSIVHAAMKTICMHTCIAIPHVFFMQKTEVLSAKES